MGDAGGQGGTAARLTTELRAAYDAAAAQWAGGPEQMYARLAGVLVAAAPVAAAGRSVLDLGAGTGVARPVGTDTVRACTRVNPAAAALSARTWGSPARDPGARTAYQPGG